MAATPTKRTYTIKLSTLGLQKQSVSMGLGIERTGSTKLEDLDWMLCATALKVHLIPAKDVEGQKQMFDEDLGMEFTAESTAIRIGKDHVSGSLRIPLEQMKISKFLKHFAHKSAKLIIERTGDAAGLSDPEIADDDDDTPTLKMGAAAK